MHRVRPTIVIVATILGLVRPGHTQHRGDMLIGASAASGGALTLVYDFARRVRVTASASGGGNTLYTTTDPGFDLVVTPGNGVFPLTSGVPVTLTITGLDPGVSMKIGATTLDAVGKSKLLGTSPSIHVHPSWQMVLPTGVEAERMLSFRLTTTAAGYTQSVVYTAILSNTTTTVTTSTTTTSAAPTTTTTSAPATTSTIVSTTTTTAAPTTTTSSTMPPLPHVELLAAKTLVLSEKNGRPERRALHCVSKDRSLTLGRGTGSPDDPTLAGGTLRVVGLGGGGFDTVHSLPADAWTVIGKPAEGKGYRYRDARRLHGPVTAIVVKAGKQIRIAGRGAGLAFALGDDPAPVAVELAVGAHRYCFAFGGTTRFRPGRLFAAKDSPAPASCIP